MPNSCIFQDIITGIKSHSNAWCIIGCVVCYWGEGRKWVIRTDFYSSSEPLTVYYWEAMTEF